MIGCRRTTVCSLVLGPIAILLASVSAQGSIVPSGGGSGLVAQTVPRLGATFPTPIQHIIVVYLENQPQSAVLSKGVYEEQLSDQYASATKYYGICHPSASNYLAGTSGASWQCGSDRYTTYATTNLADLLRTKGFSWMAYAESIPTPCYTAADTSLYVRHHNPWIYYQDIVDHPATCALHDVGFPPLWSAINSTHFPNFAWVSPNMDNDGHNTGVLGADRWLKNWLPSVLAQPWFAHTVVFVTYDESLKSDTSGYSGAHGGHVYFTAVSPFAKGRGSFTTDSSHYNLLSTIEWLFGLGSTGHHDGTSGYPAMKSLFTFGSVRLSNLSSRVTNSTVPPVTPTDGLGTTAVGRSVFQSPAAGSR
jgi:hypothetical protein